MNIVKTVRFYLGIVFLMVTLFETSNAGKNGDIVSKLARLPAEISKRLSDYWHLYKVRFFQRGIKI